MMEACYLIAEMSANHAGDLSRALEIVHAAKEAAPTASRPKPIRRIL